MAAVTVDRREIVRSSGRVREIILQVDIANNGDTLTLADFEEILFATATAETAVGTGITISGNVITFATGGALTDVKVLVLGY